MSAPYTPYPPPSRSSGPKVFPIVLASVLGTGIVLTLTCAAACVGVFKLSEGLTETEIVEQLREPLAPHVGEVRTFETNWLESSQYGTDVMVYDVDGSLGKGRVVVLHPMNDGRMEVTWALLERTAGEPSVLVGSPPERFLAEN